MEELITNIINTISTNFDFTYCLVVNIGTYSIIKTINSYKPNVKITTWYKRLIMAIFSILLAIGYYFTGSEIKVLFNSFILAPVSWAWIFKPVCNKLNIGYNKTNEDIES